MLKKLFFIFVFLALAIGAILTAWYQIDGQPLTEAADFLVSDAFVVEQQPDGGYRYIPQEPNGFGVLILHGALIKPLSYAKSAAAFAVEGYLVHVPHGAARLSINAVNSAALAMREAPVKAWFTLGHSMGGYSTLKLLTKHAPNVRASALWAASMPEDFSTLTTPLLYIRGENDGLIPPDRFADVQRSLPSTTRYFSLADANHKDFAMYSHQFFDNKSKLGWQSQIDSANAMTLKFFAQFHQTQD